MKSVLISIKPKYCELIASGKKTVEIRKTRPKLETPFKCYIYCTQSELLTRSHYNGKIYVATSKKYQKALERNGNITLSGKEIPHADKKYKFKKYELTYANYDCLTQWYKLDMCENCYKEFLKFVNRKPCEGRCKDAEPKQGLVFSFFDEKYIYEVPKDFEKFCVSCDYGTINPFSLGLWGKHKGSWYRINEFYHNARKKGYQMTDEEYYRELVKLTANTNVKFVVVDPAATSFIECIKRHGKFTVIRGEWNPLANAYKALETGKIKICKNCSNILSEIFTYSNDTPIGKDDHAISDMTYFVNAMERGII